MLKVKLSERRLQSTKASYSRNADKSNGFLNMNRYGEEKRFVEKAKQRAQFLTTTGPLIALKPGTHLKPYLQHQHQPPPLLSLPTFCSHHHHILLESNAPSCQIICRVHLCQSVAASPTCHSSPLDTWIPP